MTRIKLTSKKSNPITIRINTDFLEDIDLLVNNLKNDFNIEITRNVILEKLLMASRDLVSFDIEGKEYKFDDLIKNKKIEQIEDEH